jgi:hypothetical protein
VLGCSPEDGLSADLAINLLPLATVPNSCRSRGGRNTKIHALADSKGRLIAILLIGSEAHDCPAAGRLIRRVEPAERMLGDEAYDSSELRDVLDERRTKPVSQRKLPFSLKASL